MFDFGLTELFFETSEPENAEVPIERVLARLPKGKYTFEAETVETGESQRRARFTHRIPAGPRLLAPEDGSVGVDPNNVVVAWDSVTEDIHGAPLKIVGYQVIVEKDEVPQFPQGFAQPNYSVYLPASATSVSVPATFFEDDACYKCEVLAIEKSGNQTLSSAAFATGSGCEQAETSEDETPKLTATKLLIEHNATDEDTGFQGFADGDPWNRLTISGPDGDIVTVLPQGGLFNFGLTELFFETSEPENAEVSIEDVLARLPEGTYTFTGDMVDGELSTMTASFSHKIPAGPVLQEPIDGSTDVDANNVVVAWNPVAEDINGSDIQIVGYQVIVEKDEEPQYPQGFAQAQFSIYLPATATSVAVPPEFMESDAPYKYEVLAIEESGNQTLSSAEFATKYRPIETVNPVYTRRHPMKAIQQIVFLFVFAALAVTGCGGGGSSSGGGNGGPSGKGDPSETPLMEKAKLLIEHNATDEDTGFQGFADGDPWNSLKITDPSGNPILSAIPEGGLLNFGLTEFFFETSEPENTEVPIGDVLARLPEGEFTISGLMVDADDSSLTTPFSHAIPQGPVLLTPVDGSTGVDPRNVMVSWEPVTATIDDADVAIVGYEVIVEEDGEPQYPQGFARALFSVHLPASATSVSIPETFFKDNACYKYEVLAIEASGNQTLSSAEFETN